MSMELVGLKAVLQRLLKLDADTRVKAVPKALGAEASKLRKTAKVGVQAYAKTGRMAGSVFAARDRRDRNTDTVKFRVGYRPGKNRNDPKGAYYALMQELGTVKFRGKNTMRNALFASQNELTQNFADRLRQFVDTNTI